MEIISLTIICLVIMIPIDRIGANCTMLDSRVSMHSNFKVNGWIDDDLLGDSDNQFVERADDNIDMDRLQNIIIQGLNLTRIPNVSKMNISHSEYTEKYNLYLDIIRRREQMEQQIDLTDPMYSMSAKKLFVFSQASM
ncbi:hypothetical protein Bhyg_06167 [Pseudolycoriella hygida]|uniref:Uncharacterized protein n=1 Tax=Pseudolycoriella hygida TaxID=35572 RepID=A0A9Q0S0Q4_9DIPT|nr:hypothetical protein Bhyg_06167 [Pseudolycoriella hygida]